MKKRPKTHRNQNDTYVKIGEFEGGGLIMGTSANIETPHNPLVCVEILEEARGFVAINFSANPKTIRKIAKKLMKTADISEKKIQEYWEIK